ncbi:MAG: AzlD domain-containing protein [Clostridium sp.]|nr:AzlD domain-containing protein [Clostridium sp.]
MIKTLLMVFIMASITYILRVIPITLIRKKIESPYIKAFLNYVPFAILGALTVPDVFYSTQNMTSAILGTVVALVVAYTGRGLLTVTVAAIVTVLLYDMRFQLLHMLFFWYFT